MKIKREKNYETKRILWDMEVFVMSLNIKLWNLLLGLLKTWKYIHSFQMLKLTSQLDICCPHTNYG